MIRISEAMAIQDYSGPGTESKCLMLARYNMYLIGKRQKRKGFFNLYRI